MQQSGCWKELTNSNLNETSNIIDNSMQNSSFAISNSNLNTKTIQILSSTNGINNSNNTVVSNLRKVQILLLKEIFLNKIKSQLVTLILLFRPKSRSNYDNCNSNDSSNDEQDPNSTYGNDVSLIFEELVK
ncbi:hypothetical protein F8M41_025779 [Gigaspora margarita]|uniref:Uncharacterized protein n=1 Tax=Gigaspora margarita TaxID=4874 RepID=A0A8H4A9X3_GIGMA|nr:hypothetical protein F8M41_025779 [Gigaspora margarita]